MTIEELLERIVVCRLDILNRLCDLPSTPLTDIDLATIDYAEAQIRLEEYRRDNRATSHSRCERD